MNKHLIFFIFISPFIFSQTSKYSSIRTYCNKSNSVLNLKYQPVKEDTCLYVVTTRHYSPNDSFFLDYDYDTTATLKYFAVYFHGNHWVSVPKNTLEELLGEVSIDSNLVVYTEGLGRIYHTAVDRGTRMMRNYGVQVLMFDWPTFRPYMKEGKNFRTTYRVSEKVSFAYAKLLDSLQASQSMNDQKYKSVNLFFHSMGNLVLMHAVNHQYFKDLKPEWFNNLILNAACVPQKHHTEWLSKLNISKNIYLTRNNHDKILNGAKLVLAQHQLGERPKRHFLPTATYVNFSPVLKLEHNYFLLHEVLTQSPYIKDFYQNVLKGKKENFDPEHFKVEKELTPNQIKCFLPDKKSFSVSFTL